MCRVCASCCEIACVLFFQAEDGIRDWSVTGVQTCALPIWGLFKGICFLTKPILPSSRKSCEVKRIIRLPESREHHLARVETRKIVLSQENYFGSGGGKSK